ncbi:MAG TPA: hypothetical protein VK186_13160 [Candidatus Deferrimicrobium sp.]|nr:hypothetical protein [Candidatus Deferrimicrobium sp.]
MIEEIFPGVNPLSAYDPYPGTCICGCLCTPSDPKDTDFDADKKTEG